MAPIKGYDGSGDMNRPAWGRVVDWKATGCSFGIWRASCGSRVDPRCGIETGRMLAAGVVPGAYLLLLHGRKMKPQVDAAMRAMGPRFQPGWLPLTMDFEGHLSAYGVTPRQAMDGLLEAIDLYVNRMGHFPLIYTSWHIYRDELHQLVEPKLIDCGMWIVWCKTGAPKVPPPHGPGGYWLTQRFVEAEKQPGCSAKVDVNYWNTSPLTSTRAAWVARRIGGSDKATIKAWQSKQGLVADGIVGPRTFSQLGWLAPAFE